MAKKIGDAYVEIGSKVAGFTKGMDQTQKRLAKVSKGFSKFGSMLTTRVTLPVLALGGIATRSFAKFSDSMRNVNVIARESEEQFSRTSESVLELSKELGKSPTDLADALYNINSASFVAAEGMKVLEAAARAGVAGVADTATAAKGITAVLNAYGMSAGSAGDVSDILFKTVEKGVLTFGELSNFMGTAIGSASALGIKFEEVAAAAATMTKGGIGTAETFTALNRLMMRFLKPSESLSAAMKIAGFESGEAMFKAKGLGDVMSWLNDVTGGSTQKLADMGFMIRDLKAAIKLTGAGAAVFAKDLDSIADPSARAGATQNALNEQMKSFGFRLRQLRSQVSAVSIKLGKALMPIVEKLVNWVSRLMDKWEALSPAMKDTIIKAALLTAAIGPIIKVFGALLSPIGLVVAAVSGFIALVTIAIGRIREQNDELKKQQEELRKSGEEYDKWLRLVEAGEAGTLDEVKKRIAEEKKAREEELRLKERIEVMGEALNKEGTDAWYKLFLFERKTFKKGMTEDEKALKKRDAARARIEQSTGRLAKVAAEAQVKHAEALGEKLAELEDEQRKDKKKTFASFESFSGAWERRQIAAATRANEKAKEIETQRIREILKLREALGLPTGQTFARRRRDPRTGETTGGAGTFFGMGADELDVADKEGGKQRKEGNRWLKVIAKNTKEPIPVVS